MQTNLFEEPPSAYYPTTRYQGSKRKLLPLLSAIFRDINFHTCLDLFSGSGSVSYLLRTLGKDVVANDYLKYNTNTAEVFLKYYSSENFKIVTELLPQLLNDNNSDSASLVRDNFADIFFTDSENIQIDRFCHNVASIAPNLKRLAIYSVGQALLKKRPYNLFHRANLAMRFSDVKRSFGNKVTWDGTIESHARKSLQELNKLGLHRFTEGTALNLNTRDLHLFPEQVEMLYLDPPYIPAKGKAIDYCDFYCFLDGLLDYELFRHPSNKANHRPIKQESSAWNIPSTARAELQQIIEKWQSSTIVLSYRSDGALTPTEIEVLFLNAGRSVETIGLGEYKYALAHSQTSNEIAIVSHATSTCK
jgi:adenine-specific DNA-methyltransferase